LILTLGDSTFNVSTYIVTLKLLGLSLHANFTLFPYRLTYETVKQQSDRGKGYIV